jgi:gliding motility-associated-like protein
VTDFAGCQTTASATLTAPANCCTFSISAIISQASCGNADGAIAVSATNGSGNYTYVWSANANTGNSSSAANLSASVYSLTVTDNGFANCFLDTFFSVSNPNAPVISSVTVINETCPGTADGSISITAAGGTGIFSYTWSANASIGNVATATGLGSGVYNYTVTDAANCVATGSSTVQSGFCCSLQTNATVTQTSCGLSNGSIDISVLSGGQPNYSYSINGGASQAGNVFTNLSGGAYIVITTDNNNCKDTISVTVNQSSNNMSLTVTGIDPTCFGATDGSATAVVYGNTGNVSWNWSNQQITPAISGLTAGSYTVTATDVNTCTASGSATISQPAPLSLYIGNDTVVCNSLPYLITAPSGYTAYNWSNGATSESVSISNSGSYSLVVTNANGCTTADNVNVQFGSSAGLSAGPDAELYYGTSLGLFPVVTGSSSGSFLWSPAEGLSCTDCKNPVANPLQTTAYQLTYTDENGCVVADTLVLTVLPQGVAFFPTAFSPNGDGNNDTFHVLGSQIRNYNISIYNRWGEKVFTSNNIAEGWDGTYKEVEQPMGVYIYYASVIFMQNETRQFKGSITLIR